jgi:hypothetical protein
MARPSTSDIRAVKKLIGSLPSDSKRHVEAVADALRKIVARDNTQEVEIAFALVLAELVARTHKH